MSAACVLGQGSAGRRHAALLAAAGFAVRTYDPAVPGGCGSETEALAGADVAVVASPSSEHERQAMLALSAGVPVLVEKPPALDAEGAGRLERRSRERGVPLGVAMNLRFHPGVVALRRLLPRAGKVGLAEVWCGSYLPDWRPGTDYRVTYSAQRALGGGVLLDAIHELDYLCWLLGPVSSVSAQLSRVSDLGIDVEDVALLRLEHASGALANVTLNYLDRGYHRGCRIAGAQASLDWDWGRETVSVSDGEVQRVAADVAPTYERQLTAFVDAVRRGTPPPVGADEARAVLAVVDAARASSLAGGAAVGIE
jgi:predicted dehydrogenase